MRLFTFRYGQDVASGVLLDESKMLAIRPAIEKFGDPGLRAHLKRYESDIVSLLQGGDEILDGIQQLAEQVNRGMINGVNREEFEGILFDLHNCQLQAPVQQPSKIIAIGLNYMDHCREQNVPQPEKPVNFTKFPSSINGPDEPICWNTRLTQQVDFEAELGVGIGRTANRVAAADACLLV